MTSKMKNKERIDPFWNHRSRHDPDQKSLNGRQSRSAAALVEKQTVPVPLGQEGNIVCPKAHRLWGETTGAE